MSLGDASALDRVFDHFIGLMIAEYYPGQTEKTQDDHDAWCANRLELYVEELSGFSEFALRKGFRDILRHKKSQSWPSVKECIDACSTYHHPDRPVQDCGDAFQQAVAAKIGAIPARVLLDGVTVTVEGVHAVLDTSAVRSRAGEDLSVGRAGALQGMHAATMAEAAQRAFGVAGFKVRHGHENDRPTDPQALKDLEDFEKAKDAISHWFRRVGELMGWDGATIADAIAIYPDEAVTWKGEARLWKLRHIAAAADNRMDVRSGKLNPPKSDMRDAFERAFDAALAKVDAARAKGRAAA